MIKPLALALIGACALAAPASARDLPLERIFADPELTGPTPRQLKLSPDGRFATLLRNRADDADRFDLWAIDTATGEARMLVDSEALGTGAELSEEEKMQRERARISGTKGIVAYAWAPDGQSILVPIDGDLYLAALDGSVRRLTETEQTELNAAVSPGGRYVGFVRDQNMFVHDRSTGEERQLTTTGGGTLSWGVAEFVAQEEMGRNEGFWFSPDDSRVAVARVDESGVMVMTRAAIGADGTRLFDQRYPRAGTPNAVVDLFIISPEGGDPIEVDLGADDDIYLARVAWAPDGEVVYVQRQNREQTRLDLLRVDATTGASEILFSEEQDSWINLHDNLRLLDDGRILWTSERDGFSHIYLWDAGEWTQLTRGDWAVERIVGVDAVKGHIFFTGNRETPLERHLYRLDLARPDAIARLTPDGGWNEAVMDEEASRALVTRSTPLQPAQVYLADAAGERLAWIEQNALDADHPYAPFLDSHVVPEFGTMAAADGSTLHWSMMKPQLAPGQRAPVLVQVYGGPGVQRVSRSWTSAIDQHLVDRGWIVFRLDNRGSINRGKAFEDQIGRAMAGVEVIDQVAAAEWLKRQPFVDPDRVAVNGWSYGGYMVLALLQRSPGTFAAGVSGAPVTKWELYDTHYTERYLGNPAIDPAPYAASNVIADAGKIADPLLLIHGMADDNVLFDHSTALMAELQKNAVPFDLMVYPGQTHRVTGDGISLHLWKTIIDFLEDETDAAGD